MLGNRIWFATGTAYLIALAVPGLACEAAAQCRCSNSSSSGQGYRAYAMSARSNAGPGYGTRLTYGTDMYASVPAPQSYFPYTPGWDKNAPRIDDLEIQQRREIAQQRAADPANSVARTPRNSMPQKSLSRSPKNRNKAAEAFNWGSFLEGTNARDFQGDLGRANEAAAAAQSSVDTTPQPSFPQPGDSNPNK